MRAFHISNNGCLLHRYQALSFWLPRNIEESIKDKRGVELYNVDDLGSLIEVTMRNRTAEAQKAEDIVKAQINTTNAVHISSQ